MIVFQGTSLAEIGESTVRLSGVRTVWVHRSSEHHARMWVLIDGLGDSAWFTRRRVHAEVLSYLRAHHPAIDASGFVLEGYIFTDGEEAEQPPIPQSARQITRSEMSAYLLALVTDDVTDAGGVQSVRNENGLRLT